MNLRELELAKHLSGDKSFELGKSKFLKRQFFSIGILTHNVSIPDKVKKLS